MNNQRRFDNYAPLSRANPNLPDQINLLKSVQDYLLVAAKSEPSLTLFYSATELFELIAELESYAVQSANQF